jgi:hypothetical protein
LTTWDVHLNQKLAAIRFNINESSSFSPFYLLYNRDVVLPIDNILKPRRRYLGEDPHKIAIEQQHKTFTMVQRILKRSKKRQAKYANRNAVDIDLKVGDPVYYKNNQRQSKLQSKWKPFYRIIEQISPVTFKIKNQLDGKVTKAHKELLRLAKLDEWEIPKNDQGRPLRKAAYVVPPESESDTPESDGESDNPERFNEENNEQNADYESNEPVYSDNDSLVSDQLSETEMGSEEENIPLAKLAKKFRKERENSSSEDDIPLYELSKRLKQRKRENTDHEVKSESDNENDELSMDVNECKLQKTIKQKKIPNKTKEFKILLQTLSRLL